jgi:hypothetical protein
MRVVNSPGRPQRATIRDRQGAPLEQRLNEVLARMGEAARLIREERQERERQRKKWEEEEQRQLKAQKQAEVKQARYRRLEELVDRWRAQEDLKAFVEVIRKRMEVARPELIPAARAWVEWANEYIDQSHPEDALFFEPLLEHGTSEFWHYSSPRAPYRL